MNTLETNRELDRLFTYHPPVGSQPQRYEDIRAVGREMARIILWSCPRCADTDQAVLKVREAVMMANAAIACNEERV
jgi:hypothetical protein